MRPILCICLPSQQRIRLDRNGWRPTLKERKCWSLPRPASVSITQLQQNVVDFHYQLISRSLPVLNGRTRLHASKIRRETGRPKAGRRIYTLGPPPRGGHTIVEIAKCRDFRQRAKRISQQWKDPCLKFLYFNTWTVLGEMTIIAFKLCYTGEIWI